VAPDFDAVVVGSGAGGGVAACVLANRGWKVALIEKGRNPYPTLADPELRGSLLGNDEIRWRRAYAYQDPLVEPRVWQSGATRLLNARVQSLGVTVGGGTVQYDADCPRIQRTDLKMRSTFGAVAGADVVDWPLDYSELEPFYDAAESLIGVQGEAGADPFAEERNPFPMPPGYPSKSGLLLSAGATALGYHPHPMPMAITSMRYRGRPACVSCGFCRGGCPVNAKSSTAVTAVRDALLTGNCTLLCECCVTGVETEPSGQRATGVRYLDKTGAAARLTARHVVLAANAIETPRLLLESATAAHPDGLGNGSGLVGRYLMFHIVFSAVGTFDEEVRSYRGRIITHAVGDFTAVKPGPGVVRGGYVELGGQLHPVDEASEYPWFLHRELMGSGRFRRNMATAGMIGEDVPVRDNRVVLDDTVRDVYGRAAPRLIYNRHPHDQQVVDVYLPKLEEIARAAGAKEVVAMDFLKRDGFSDSKHLLGTTRMGVDPALSVTDRWGRLHEVENVWVCDGGVYPTSTAFNPTLTQQALAYRTAAFMADPGNPRP
jgi:choline dehydrogenase-like flavoprotein